MRFCHFTILRCCVNVFVREGNKVAFFFLVEVLHLVIQISLQPPLQKPETSTDWLPIPRVTCSLSNTCHRTDKGHSQVRERTPGISFQEAGYSLQEASGTGVPQAGQEVGSPPSPTPCSLQFLRHGTPSTRTFLRKHLTRLPNILGVQR